MPPTGALLLAAAGAGFNGDVLQLIANSGAVAKAVLFVLLGFSVLSWAVILERHRSLKRAERDSVAFLRDLHRETRLVDLLHRSERYADSPLSRLFVAGFRELTTAVTDGLARRAASAPSGEAHDWILSRVQRRLDETAAAEADGLDRNLGILATTGSVTPFIGLFGTVWGIMNAFQGIGVTGSANLAAVAPGISEALITTAAGLAAAIPAVIGYNLLNARGRRLGARIDRFVLEFAGIAESQIDAHRGAAPAAEAGKLRV